MANQPQKSAVILLAGGKSSRMQGAVQDKILWKLNQKEIILYSLEVFSQLPSVIEIMIVARDDEQEANIRSLLPANTEGLYHFCRGGAERQDSVHNGLTSIQSSTDIVFIHDSARPLITLPQIKEMASILQTADGVTLAHRVSDSIKRSTSEDPTTKPSHLADVDRSRLWAMETPQAFRYPLILQAYSDVTKQKIKITDDNAAFEKSGQPVQILENNFPNPKITYPSDIEYLEYLMSKQT